ncbi:antitoxin [Sphingomonas sp.]|uniref:antitoxin n=1 Tax=Sphingomonas sp. TaxID=28214 RepID=UPI0025F62F2B|nr:antitoxin [Sphingomonas sp.]
MKPERSIFDDVDPATEEAALREAEADIAAGREVSHEEVVKWLRTWGTDESGPPPESWFK